MDDGTLRNFYLPGIPARCTAHFQISELNKIEMATRFSNAARAIHRSSRRPARRHVDWPLVGRWEGTRSS